MVVRTEGADQLDRIASRLQRADSAALSKHVSREVRDVVKPLGMRVLDRASSGLPRRGGLADLVAQGGRVGVGQRLRGESISVTVSLRMPGMDIMSMDRGRLRHPVFGNRERWVDQRIRPRLFTDALKAEAPAARAALLRAGQKALNEMVGS